MWGNKSVLSSSDGGGSVMDTEDHNNLSDRRRFYGRFVIGTTFGVMQWDAVVNSVVSTLTPYLRLSGSMHSCAHAERLELVGLEAHGTPQVQVHDGETFMVAYWGELFLIDLMSQGTRTLHRRCYPPRRMRKICCWLDLT